jgi:hypothetical protein
MLRISVCNTHFLAECKICGSDGGEYYDYGRQGRDDTWVNKEQAGSFYQ